MFEFLNSKDEKAVDKAVSNIVKAYGKIKAQTHIALVAVVEFSNENRDGSKLDKLWNGLPNNANKRGIALWLKEYSGWKMSRDKAGNDKFLSRDEDGNKAFWLKEQGKALPFYDMGKVQKDIEAVFDFDKALDGLISKAIKAEKDKRLTDPRQMAEVAFLATAMPKFRKRWEAAQAKAAADGKGEQVEPLKAIA